MSARIPPGFGEITWQFRIAADPEPMICSMGVDLSVGTVPNVAEANAMLSAGMAVLDGLLSSLYTIGPGWVTYGQDGPDDIRVEGTIDPVVGGGGTTVLPNNCAWLLRKVSALGGRRNRGRMYIPGPSETTTNEIGIVSASGLASLQSAADALLNDIVSLATIDALVILHSSAPFTPTPITNIVAVNRIATQRRRMRP